MAVKSSADERTVAEGDKTEVTLRTDERLIGVTVLPEYVQSEGVDAVLDRLERAGVTAVATSPYVMEAADERTGQREPPADAGAGSVRLLDRPLWGKRELFVKTAPSFTPDKSLYDGLRYQPAEPTALTAREGHLVAGFLDAAKARGLQVFFQIQAAIPPGYRVQFGGPHEEDIPRLPDGTPPRRRVANNGSLASPHIVGYTKALTRDLLRCYPQLDGIRYDWPEYPPYLLDSVFLDFGEHARRAAGEMGFDFEQMQRDVAALYRHLHGELNDKQLSEWTRGEGGRFRTVRSLTRSPGLLAWLHFKASLVERLLNELRGTLDSCSGRRLQMQPNAFPPPWSLASGFDFSRAAEYSSAISVKLYGMHWSMMVKFYADQLLEANPRLDRQLLCQALLSWLDIVDDPHTYRLDQFYYPGPDEPHLAGEDAQRRKIAQAQYDAGDCPIHVLAHGYGPVDDFRRRLRVALEAGPHGVWLNRYGYLSDEKLEVLRTLPAEL